MVFFSEMGDKSQLMAMSLATRYPISTVLIGVAGATFLNNGLAILAGLYLKTTLDIPAIQIIASLLFILFGLWNLWEKKEKKLTSEAAETSPPIKSWKPLLTIVPMFFLAEMGDKTQLATVAYVVKYDAPLRTLLGVMAGMVAADALGIIGGSYLARLFSPRTVKLISSAIFIIIGLVGLLR